MSLRGKIGGVLAAAAIGLSTLAVPMPAQAASKTVDGCPRGYVCLYERDASLRKSHLQKKWFDYGTYNLRKVYGRHYLMNNQWGGAYVSLYTKYDGRGKCYGFKAKSSGPVIIRPNFTPINSIRLTKHLPSGCKRA